MPPRSSAAGRFVRTLTALVTVWCLGCSAFEPLLEQLLGGAGSRDVCALAMSMPMGTAATKAEWSSGPAVAAVADRTPAGVGCACESCMATSPTVYALVTLPLATPDVPVMQPGSPLAVTREPLVPPPERAL